ncbi:hypothetical protein [Lachnoclostridium phytofermentans]|uniref:Uncharacterized protein n=1 Tax=Lachnoclostridium phytofermentans (strain ATCC 700394 / DSM 18823 / ISDg) TaxID=357809 RepID=A9KI18_LACP7|nr:hypothetical protein [Lachnoclostridium phytofermentans]ABX43865.1 hypothetical protein Cphy_3516 [Lachnoclostridium phytofermentans ISDg]
MKHLRVPCLLQAILSKAIILLVIISLSIVMLLPCKMVDATAARAPQTNVGNTDQSGKPIILANDRVVVTLQYGFEQQARYGRTIQVTAKIYNKGESFTGEIAATIMNEEQDNIRYATTATILGLEKNVVTLNIPMNRASKSMKFELLSSSKDTIVEEVIPLNVVNLGTYYYVGILSDMSTPLSYFEYFGNKCVYLDKSNFPSDYFGLDMIDVLVIENFKISSLTEEQQQAILGFVKRGGTLVFGSEAYYEDGIPAIKWLSNQNIVSLEEETSDFSVQNAKISMKEPSEFSDLLLRVKGYETLRASNLKYKEDIKNKEPQKDCNLYIGKSILGNKIISDLKFTSVEKTVTVFSTTNATKKKESNNLTIYEKVPYGEGNVLVFHFPLGMEGLTEAKILVNDGVSGKILNTFYLSVVSQVLEDIPAAVKKHLEVEQYANFDNYRVQGIINNSNSIDVPKVFPYTILLVVYIVIIGPLLYFILHKKKKNILVWVLVPCLSLVFSCIVYVMGTNTRITEPYISYFNVETYDPNTKTLEAESNVNVYLSSNQKTELSLGDANEVIAGKYQYPTFYDVIDKEKPYDTLSFGEAVNTSVLKSKDSYSLMFDHIPAFTPQYFSLDYSRELDDEVTGQVSVTESTMSGSVTNDTSENFEEAYVYYNGRVALLGDLESGESASLEECSQEYNFNIYSILYNSNSISVELGNQETKISPDRVRKNNALSMVIEEGLYAKEGAYLIGFIDSLPKEHPFSSLSNNRASYGVSMMVVPLELNTTTGDVTLVPNLDRYLKAGGSNYYDNALRYVYTNSIELEYQLPKEDEISKLVLADVFQLSLNQDTNYYLLAKKIYFYNRTTSQYDLVFRSDLLQDGRYQKVNAEDGEGDASLSAEELKDYLSKEHELKIKYEGEEVEMSGVFTIPVISYIKMAN